MENGDRYIELMKDFCLNEGITRQMEAFKSMFTQNACIAFFNECSCSFLFLKGGFDRVFSMKKLSVFSPYELRLMMCGEQAPSWTREDVLKYTEPKYGYTKERYV